MSFQLTSLRTKTVQKIRFYSKRVNLLPLLATELVLRLLEHILRPKSVICPVCGWTGFRFRAVVHKGTRTINVLCDRCRTGSRARALVCFLKREKKLRPGMCCLDFGPRLAYSNLFDEYQCRLFFADIVANDVDAKLDIVNLGIKDDALNLVICYHVLEHVCQDRLALKELHRILRPGGDLLLQVPLDPKQRTTVEYKGNSFSPKDHVREYGRDILEKVIHAGFEVIPREDRQGLSVKECQQYGITSAISFICRKI
jgi:SAM-dependent methyltransferase